MRFMKKMFTSRYEVFIPKFVGLSCSLYSIYGMDRGMNIRIVLPTKYNEFIPFSCNLIPPIQKGTKSFLSYPF